MEKNVGGMDRVARLIGGLLLLFVGYIFIDGWLETVLIILGLVLIITGLVSRCGLYYPLGISTCKASPEKESK